MARQQRARCALGAGAAALLVAGAWGSLARAAPASATPPPDAAAESPQAAAAVAVAAAIDTSGPPSKPQRGDGGASLGRCLALADRAHPDLLVGRSQVARARAQLTEAYFAPYMGFQAWGGLSLAPTVLGNSVYSPNTDASLTSSLGVAWQAGISGVLPLWTFGKITNLWDAAEANVRVEEAEAEVTRDAIRFDVRRAYFGLQLARDALALLDDAQEKMTEAIDELEAKVEDEGADPIDLLKLQTFAAELTARRSEAQKAARVALAGLRFFTGSPHLDIPDLPIREGAHQLLPLGRYVDASRSYRPDVAMARAGVDAREAQVRMARSELFPSLGLAMQVGVSAAPEVANQINPFTSDPGNYFHYGIALVFHWRLDLVPQWARIEQAQAQLDEVQALSIKATSGVAAEIEEAYAEVEDWRRRLAAYRSSSQLAKRWLTTVQQAIDVGTMEDKEIIDPAKAYAEQRYNVLRATMELNLALSKLAKVTGWDAIAPDGP